MTDIRENLLNAAIQLYAEGGYRGTTTRKVAQLADVNEITLFRHFGTKDELLRAALLRERQNVITAAPALDVADVAGALLDWATTFHERLFNHRQLIRQILGDATAHPQLRMDPCDGADDEAAELARWFHARHARGDFAADANPMVAAYLTVNALFTDAMWRDMAPTEHMPPVPLMLHHLVVFVLRGLGFTGEYPAEPSLEHATALSMPQESV